MVLVHWPGIQRDRRQGDTHTSLKYRSRKRLQFQPITYALNRKRNQTTYPNPGQGSPCSILPLIAQPQQQQYISKQKEKPWQIEAESSAATGQLGYLFFPSVYLLRLCPHAGRPCIHACTHRSISECCVPCCCSKVQASKTQCAFIFGLVSSGSNCSVPCNTHVHQQYDCA
jgi:hypothetical protein